MHSIFIDVFICPYCFYISLLAKLLLYILTFCIYLSVGSYIFCRDVIISWRWWKMKICFYVISLCWYTVEDMSWSVMLSGICVSGHPVLFQILKWSFQCFTIKWGVHYRDFIRVKSLFLLLVLKHLENHNWISDFIKCRFLI